MANIPKRPLRPAGTLSSPKKFGSIGDHEFQPDFSVSDDGKGLMTGTMRFFYNCPANKPKTNIIKAGEEHPTVSQLLCNAVTTTIQANEISYVEASYVGLAEDPAGVTWTLNTPTEDEPIEMHPDFAKTEKSWGTVTQDGYNPLNGQPYWNNKNVIVSTDGRFEGFRFNEDNWKNKFVGVTSYKAPRATCSVSFFTANAGLVKQAIDARGKIAKPAFVTLPLEPTGEENWLCIGASCSPYSDKIFQVQMEFVLSGQRGWNDKIYPTVE